MTAIYAGTGDVRRILQTTFPFSGTSFPTDDNVIATIEDVQDEIDHITKHAWREKTVTNEFFDFSKEYPVNYLHLDPGIPIFLRHREVREMGTASGDKLEIWDGGTAYTDYVATKTKGRNNDFWLDTERGILYVKIIYPFFTQKAAKITYRYGASVVPKDIRRATSYMVAIELLQNDINTNILGDTGQPQLDYATRINQMQAKVDKILKNRSEIIVI
jgi:hypothetical protein